MFVSILFVRDFLKDFVFIFVFIVLLVLFVVVVLVVVLFIVVVLVVLVRCRSWVCSRWGMGKTIVWSTKVVQFSGVNGVVVVGGKRVKWEEVGRLIVVIIFIVVNGLVGSPFNNKAIVLKEWLTFVFGQSFNASDGHVINVKDGPLVAGYAGTRGKGKEIIISIGVAGGGQSNGTK